MTRSACDVPGDEGWLQVVRPPPQLAAQALDAGITFRGYSVGSRPGAEVQSHVQQIVAWILHRVTHDVGNRSESARAPQGHTGGRLQDITRALLHGGHLPRRRRWTWCAQCVRRLSLWAAVSHGLGAVHQVRHAL